MANKSCEVRTLLDLLKRAQKASTSSDDHDFSDLKRGCGDGDEDGREMALLTALEVAEANAVVASNDSSDKLLLRRQGSSSLSAAAASLAASTGNGGWMAVAEIDGALRHSAEVEAEASFGNHSSVSSDGDRTSSLIVHHHHHHHHHHYHYNQGTTSPTSTTNTDNTSNTLTEDIEANDKKIEEVKRLLRKPLFRSNTTIDASSPGPRVLLAASNSSQPGSPKIKILDQDSVPTTPTSSTTSFQRKMSGRSRRSNNSNSNAQVMIEPKKEPFDLEQMQKGLESVQVQQQQNLRRGSSRKSRGQESEIDENGQNPAAAILVAAASKNGSSSSANVKESSSGGGSNKRDKYKSLWGKVGKHGMMQAAAAASAASESSSSSAGSRKKTSSRSMAGPAATSGSGWDQVLNPLLQKQRANYNYHAQQVQKGAAVAGSGWTDDNMECDCGEDSCPRCNLLLNMGMDEAPQWQ